MRPATKESLEAILTSGFPYPAAFWQDIKGAALDWLLSRNALFQLYAEIEIGLAPKRIALGNPATRERLRAGSCAETGPGRASFRNDFPRASRAYCHVISKLVGIVPEVDTSR